jgi:hypothetical protein
MMLMQAISEVFLIVAAILFIVAWLSVGIDILINF